MEAALDAVARAEREFSFPCLDGVPAGLRTVRGLLQGMDLASADMLAEKLEQLSVHVRNLPGIREQYRGIRALHRGMGALHGHVEALSCREPESPLALADPVNRIRACLGEPPIRRFELFNPKLDRSRGEPSGSVAIGVRAPTIPQDERAARIIQLRRRHRQELLNWLKGPAGDDAAGGKTATLGRMRLLMDDLHAVSPSDELRRLWWVAGGFLEAVESGEIEPDPSFKSLLARLDQETARMEAATDADDVAVPQDELLRRMLYALGPLARSGSLRIRDIRESLGLDVWFASGPEEAGEPDPVRRGLSEMRRSFGEGRFDNLQALVGRAFDARQGDGHAAALGDLAHELEELASGAESLGLDGVAGLAREIVRTSRETSRPDGDGLHTTTENRVAASVLLLRRGVMDPDSADTDWARAVSGAVGELRDPGMPAEDGNRQAGCIQSAAEYEHLRARIATGRAIHDALERIEASLAGFGTDSCRVEDLETAAVLLHRVGNLLAMLESGTAARVAHRAETFLAGVARSPGAASGTGPAEIAVPIAALGAAVDALSPDGPDADGILSTASDILARAGGGPTPPPSGKMAAAEDGRETSSGGEVSAGAVPRAEADPAVRGVDRLDRDLMEIFTTEFRRLVEVLEHSLDALRGHTPGEPDAEEIREDIDDCVHTLGDNCRNLGFDEVAACAEGSLAPLLAAGDVEGFESARVRFRDNLGLLRSALDEILEHGRTSAALGARLLAGDGAGTDHPPVTGEGRPDGDPDRAGVPPEPAEDPDAAADADIRRMFLEESRGILGRIDRALLRWRERGPEPECLDALRREFHTLKGAAAAAGNDGVSRLVHRVESLLEDARMQGMDGHAGLLGLLEEVHDGLAAEPGPLEAGEGADLSGLMQGIAGYPAGGIADAPGMDGPGPGAPAGRAPVTESRPDRGSGDRDPDGDSAAGGAVPAGPRGAHHATLAELAHASGELDLARTQLHNALDATRMDLELLRIGMVSLRDGLREVELAVDAGSRSGPEPRSGEDGDMEPRQSGRDGRLREKLRSLSERLGQLDRVERELVRRAADIDGVLERQRNLDARLQSGLQGARMATLGDYLPHLEHLVRETARKADREVRLCCHGADLRIDRQVIESMMAPFEHMIRNAVVHGIEERAVRRQSGKEPGGTISIDISLKGAELAVSFGDDGGGLAMDRVTARAGELGLVDEAGRVSDTDALNVLIQPGFSTAGALSLEAGRGVGMEIVYRAVRDLGGSMRLTHAPGEGVGFHFLLPVTLAVTPALLVRIGQWRFALRSRSVERLVRASREELDNDGGQWSLEIDGSRVPVVLLHRPATGSEPPDPSVVLVVVVRLVDRLAAFEVDEYLESVDILARNPGTQLLSIPEISGVTVLSDSSIVPVLDPEAFVHRIGREAAVPGSGEPSRGAGGPRRVLVVDDSAVVRRVMRRDLEADGFEVETADDGVDALEKLDRCPYDAVLVDIEMPRMNGFELLRRLRENPADPGPVTIVVTSESDEAYRRRALDLGADGCITRPCDLAVLNRLMRAAAAARGGPD